VEARVTKALTALGVALVLAFALTAGALAQTSVVQQHLETAMKAAGTDHPGLFDRVCAPGAITGGNAGAAARAGGPPPTPPPPPPSSAWHAEPVKVFDNLYFVGMTEYSAWALTTSEGIILIDALFDYSVEDEVVNGLKKLGLNPAQIKYVLISHAHTDHAGGAKLLQERYGARVIMSAADWDLLDRQNPVWKPKRDIVATDGQQLTLGDATITMYITPGHTPGTISSLFTVKDGGRAHVVAAWGGTAFNFGPNRDTFQKYIASSERFRDIVTKAGADVIIANHTNFDSSKRKLPLVAKRRPGDPHPYVIGNDAVRRYVTVANECAKAALAGLP
jgi:metallo-beta-lactamase class B